MERFKSKVYGYIKDMFTRTNMVKRVVLSLISIVIMGLGIALFSVSGFGVDPFTSMNMNIASVAGIGFGTFQMTVNFIILLYVIVVAHRGLVGVGTVFNMVGCGYICEFFESILEPAVKENYTLSLRVPLLAVGIITLCFACSLFFTANVGVGPYDALGFMLSRGIRLKYKWVRVITDILAVLIGLALSGGITALINGDLSGVHNVGIGTVITAFCMGPLINLFNKTVSAKIFNVNYERLSRDVAFFMIKGAALRNVVPQPMTAVKK